MPHERDCGSPTMARAAACVSCGVHAVMTILVIHTATKTSRLESELEHCCASMLDASSIHVSWIYAYNYYMSGQMSVRMSVRTHVKTHVYTLPMSEHVQHAELFLVEVLPSAGLPGVGARSEAQHSATPGDFLAGAPRRVWEDMCSDYMCTDM